MNSKKMFIRKEVLKKQQRKTIKKVRSQSCPQVVILLKKPEEQEFEKKVIQKSMFLGMLGRISVSHSTYCLDLYN